ncbi:MAG: hypothetical protein JO015_03125 [Verrucomicrobia bacterium]|nr:hypothetical protein [Verrucomicrobiota bacterium]
MRSAIEDEVNHRFAVRNGIAALDDLRVNGGRGELLTMGIEKRKKDCLAECGLCKAFSDSQKGVEKPKLALVDTPFYDTDMEIGLCTPCAEHAQEADKGMRDSMNPGLG